jgi:hypothetical protein
MMHNRKGHGLALLASEGKKPPLIAHGGGWGTGSGSTAPLLDQLPLLLEVTGHQDPAVALLAAQCIALLASSFPEAASATLLRADAIACLGDTSSQSPPSFGSKNSAMVRFFDLFLVQQLVQQLVQVQLQEMWCWNGEGELTQ